MPSKAFSAIAEGLADAIAYAKGDARRGKMRAAEVHKVNVAKLRGRLRLSQGDFARGFGVSLGTLRNWEQNRREPQGPARVLLHVIARKPGHVLGAIWPEKNRKGRKASLHTPLVGFQKRKSKEPGRQRQAPAKKQRKS
jgi:putative transcriptional regulator